MNNINCVLCGEVEETTSHVFFTCSKSQVVWNLSNLWIGELSLHWLNQKFGLDYRERNVNSIYIFSMVYRPIGLSEFVDKKKMKLYKYESLFSGVYAIFEEGAL